MKSSLRPFLNTSILYQPLQNAYTCRGSLAASAASATRLASLQPSHGNNARAKPTINEGRKMAAKILQNSEKVSQQLGARLSEPAWQSRNTGRDSAAQEMMKTPTDYHRPYRFSVFARKSNTHITVSKPDGDAIISLSCGNIGFRKSQRKRYDTAYQLAAFVLTQLYRQGWHKKIQKMDLVLRGFGPGREAVSKAMCGYEGRLIREKVIRVMDSTRIKFGGSRSMNPRRL